MRRLTQVADDRGTVAVVVALLLVVLFGIGAYVIDVGALFEERRDLQNGADAAALALAYDCVLDGGAASDAACQSTAITSAEADSLASANSNDGAATVNGPDIVFDASAGTVNVTVHTEDASDGDGEIDFVLAPALGNDSAAVSAEATATWGAPSGLFSVPIVISSCEWDEFTTGGTVYGVYEIIYLHNSGQDPTPCSFGPGQDIDGDGSRNEGGFGYLDTASDCQAEISADGFVQGQTGAGNPSHLGCSPSDLLNEILYIPIFDDIPDATPNGCGGPPGQPCYHIYGFAAFELLDLDLTGGGWKNQGNICPPPARCLGGRFVEFVSLESIGDIGGPNPDLGLIAVGLSG